MKIISTVFFVALSLMVIGQTSFSDYFSFHGEDELGRVYFAIDNNRVQTKKGINKGDHFVYFSLDGKWIAPKGHKEGFEFENSSLEKIPSSEHFKYTYDGNEFMVSKALQTVFI